MSEISTKPFTAEEFTNNFTNWHNFFNSVRELGVHKKRDRAVKVMFSSLERLYGARFSYIKATANEENPVSAFVRHSGELVTSVCLVREVEGVYVVDNSRGKRAKPVLGKAALTTVVATKEDDISQVYNDIADIFPGREIAAREPMVFGGAIRKGEPQKPTLDVELSECFNAQLEGYFLTSQKAVGNPALSILYYARR